MAETPSGKPCVSTTKRVLIHAMVVTERIVELLTVVEKRSRVLCWHSLKLDSDQQSVSVGDSVIPASRAEYGLLHLLISCRNLPMSKEVIMSRLFGADHGRDVRQVDMFVARLRQALSVVGLAGLIQTIGGRGYAVLDDAGDTAPVIEAQPRGRVVAALAW